MPITVAVRLVPITAAALATSTVLPTARDRKEQNLEVLLAEVLPLTEVARIHGVVTIAQRDPTAPTISHPEGLTDRIALTTVRIALTTTLDAPTTVRTAVALAATTIAALLLLRAAITEAVAEAPLAPTTVVAAEAALLLALPVLPEVEAETNIHIL